MSTDRIKKVDLKKVNAAVVKPQLEFTRKIDPGTLVMSIQKDLIRVNDFAMSQERPTTYVLSDFNIQLKAVVSQESEKTMIILPTKPDELDPNSMSLVNISLKPIPTNVKPSTNTRPIEAIEGIGLLTANKLREIGIHTIADLALASPKDITKVGVPSKQASEFIGMAKLMTKSNMAGIDGVDEPAAELLVVGGKIDSKEKLAQANPEELYKNLTAAAKTKKVQLPTGFKLAPDDVARWVSSAKTQLEKNAEK
ncbi:MAG: DUF4332 domain-containing protein [Candidatus Bathyarchaeota archaeon]|nr:DUF4332 domain-containing protein [Candidatus Bathyarchaeota archaeon]